ncbi:MAG: diguanylate cyclase (GGDEF)-like protein/PAS domain S-box-containing protein [Marinomonas primoryensis]|jgi:diguanylate cyclase (GGDEF)-like protein/PAS domain S-box-containing protein
MDKDQVDKALIEDQLRAAAEVELANRQPPKTMAGPADEVLHELRVHQIELEMQNEALLQTQQALEESRNRYIDLYEFAPVGYLTLSEKGMIASINLTGVSLLGQERSKLINKSLRTLVIAVDQDKWVRHFMVFHTLTQISNIELSLQRGDGTVFQANLDCVGTPLGLRITLSDISKRKQVENELRIAATTFESQEGMMVTDVDNVLIKVNKAFTSITGYNAEEVIGNNPRMLASEQHDKLFYDDMWAKINASGYWGGEILNKRKNGEIYPENLIITAVKDSDGVVTNYVGTFTDITLSKNAEQQIEYLAYYDPLTHLPNRRLMIDRIHHAMAASTRPGNKFAIFFLDLDHFKTLNDTLGHDMGDLLLQQVATRLKKCIREGDTVSRFGGDEFVVLLEGLSAQPIEAAAQAEHIANNILASLNMPYQLVSHDYVNSTSIGITVFNGHKSDAEELLKQADIAMYQAKDDGRNAFRFFDPRMQSAITARVQLEKELIQAIEQQQFQLYYQIQVDDSDRPFGAEALIRWMHPERGLIPPFDFISLAEQNGAILVIGQWVIDSACKQLKMWQQNPLTRDLTLAVNVSAKQIHQASFVSQVILIIQQHNINPARLKLELTESLLQNDIEETIAKMRVLSDIGIQFSLDDFGTGYSSLQYLKKLPLYQLKIDKSFVDTLVVNQNDQAIVRTIIAMAHSLGLNVIAEGVETKEQQQRLLAEGCTHYQGYLFGKPMPIDQFDELLGNAD